MEEWENGYCARLNRIEKREGTLGCYDYIIHRSIISRLPTDNPFIFFDKPRRDQSSREHEDYFVEEDGKRSW